MAIIIKGLSVSKGIAIGKCYVLSRGQIRIEEEIIEQKLVSKEALHFDKAIKKTINQLKSIKNKISPSIKKNVGLFLDTHILLVKDEAFLSNIKNKIFKKNFSAQWAVYSEYLDIEKSFNKIKDSYIKQRIDDINHIVNIILENLNIKKNKIKKISKYFAKHIIVTDELSPADVLLAHESKVLGLISEFGGRSSHSSILTTSLEIPTMIGVKKALNIFKNDDEIIIDGNEGIIIINPDPKALKYYKNLQQKILKKKRLLSNISLKKSITLDKQKIELMANLELPHELKIINQKSIDGIGLFRTEYLYTDRKDLPTEYEQFIAYKKIVKKMKNHPVIFRTLDVGSDKEIPENIKTGSIARNPALGLRGIRHSLNDQVIFINQIKAILRAGYHGEVKILLPMITNLSEVSTALKLIDKAKIILKTEKVKFEDNVKVGIMIEVPSSAVLAHRFAKHIDFFSIGTNDLVQYTLAIDRIDDEVNYLYDPLNSAVLSLIKTTIDAGKKNKIPVALCGEMAGDPNYTRLLIGMGLKSFSMHPSVIPEIKNIILNTNTRKLKKISYQIIASDSPAEQNNLLIKLNNLS